MLLGLPFVCYQLTIYGIHCTPFTIPFSVWLAICVLIPKICGFFVFPTWLAKPTCCVVMHSFVQVETLSLQEYFFANKHLYIIIQKTAENQEDIDKLNDIQTACTLCI